MKNKPKKTLLLFDFSNLAHRCLHLREINAKSQDPSWGLWHYMVFMSIYEYIQTTMEVAGDDLQLEVVLALDSHDGYWRRDIYPPYKMDRKEKRDTSGIDWDRAYKEFALFIENVRKYLPWKCISAPKCEADDVIYVLSREQAFNGGQSVIISTDSDYVMLIQDNIHLWNPLKCEYVDFPITKKQGKKEFLLRDVREYRNVAVLTGQGGKDNVYNVVTPTDFQGARKPGFGIAKALAVLNVGIGEFLMSHDLHKNYERNATLIDPKQLPCEFQKEIQKAYYSYVIGDTSVERYLTEAYKWQRPNIVEATCVLNTAAGIAVDTIPTKYCAVEEEAFTLE